MASERGDSGRRPKTRPPAFRNLNHDAGTDTPTTPQTESIQPVALTGNAVANLSDHTEVQVNENKITVAIKDMEIINKLGKYFPSMFNTHDPIFIPQSGEGQYGVVEKMRHKPSNLIFAVKKIRCSMNDKEQRRLLNDLNISMRSTKCPYVVVSYGAMFQGGDVWICMELLDSSLDKFYHKIKEKDPKAFIPERLLAYITFCLVTALEYLHRELRVIHRDVKPSNTLIDKRGRVKVCDFGISGDLINSMAKTNIGSQPYLAPERINPDPSGAGYSIRSDVWSLGLSVLELAICKFPYARWNSLFDQLKDVVASDTPPALPKDSIYSNTVRHFISQCLIKKDSDRASYDVLIEHDMLTIFKTEKYLQESKKQFAEYATQVLLG